jgi:hypothetical protein
MAQHAFEENTSNMLEFLVDFGLIGEVHCFLLEHTGCVLILEAETLVLVLQVMLDLELGVFL